MKKTVQRWAGMQKTMTEELLPFYTSRAWKNCRNAYYKSKGGLCERCAKQGKTVPGYEVHHKVRLDRKTVNDPSIALSWDNLELLCIKCHHEEHKKYRHVERKKRNRRWAFDENGKLIAPPGQE